MNKWIVILVVCCCLLCCCIICLITPYMLYTSYNEKVSKVHGLIRSRAIPPKLNKNNYLIVPYYWKGTNTYEEITINPFENNFKDYLTKNGLISTASTYTIKSGTANVMNKFNFYFDIGTDKQNNEFLQLVTTNKETGIENSRTSF